MISQAISEAQFIHTTGPRDTNWSWNGPLQDAGGAAACLKFFPVEKMVPVCIKLVLLGETSQSNFLPLFLCVCYLHGGKFQPKAVQPVLENLYRWILGQTQWNTEHFTN